MLKERPVLFRVYKPPSELGSSWDPASRAYGNKFGQPIALISTYYSAIWEIGYNETGEFLLEVQATEENVESLAVGNFVTCTEWKGTMVIRSREISNNHLTVTGFEAVYIFTERAALGYSAEGDDAIDAIAQNFILYFCKPGTDGSISWDGELDLNRPYPGVQRVDYSDVAPNGADGTYLVETARYGGTMLDTIQSICQEFDWGFSCYLSEAASVSGDATYLKPRIYQGDSYSDSGFMMSEATGTISDPAYDEDDLDKRNVGYIIGYDENFISRYTNGYESTDTGFGAFLAQGITFASRWVGNEPAGWDRRENCETEDRSSNDDEMWVEWYADLREKALSSIDGLDEANESYSFNITTSQIDSLPDVGTECRILLDSYNLACTARISMITYEVDDDHVTATVTIGDANIRTVT